MIMSTFEQQRFLQKPFTLVFMLLLMFTLNTNSHAKTNYAEINIDKLANGLSSPWAMAFLPNNDILITERAGKIRIVRNGELLDQTINAVPEVLEAGQGGLMDIKLDRDFINNQTIYLSYAHGKLSANATRLISAKLVNNSLQNIKVLFTSDQRATSHHYGARIAQLKDNSLLMAVGDGYNYREHSQRLDSTLGKIIRVDQNGQAPADNPFINTDGARAEIYSTGHRNQQGLLVVDLGDSGELIIENEHGPKGGDEINVIQAGKNYGWPVITYGIDYNGARISPYTEYEGMQQPNVDWTPSIAPSSMALYTGDLFKQWHGNLFVTSLTERSIRRISVSGEQVTDHGIVFDELKRQRYRDIKTGPDGALYVLTDGTPAHVLRITPKP